MIISIVRIFRLPSLPLFSTESGFLQICVSVKHNKCISGLEPCVFVLCWSLQTKKYLDVSGHSAG